MKKRLPLPSLYSRLVLPIGTISLVLGLKMGIFSPRFIVPVEKPGLKGVTNRKYKWFLHQCYTGELIEDYK